MFVKVMQCCFVRMAGALSCFWCNIFRVKLQSVSVALNLCPIEIVPGRKI